MSIKLSHEIQKFWDDFVETDPELAYLSKVNPDPWSFGNTESMADKLLKLVLDGKKTATCSLLRAYQGFEAEIPQVGVYSVLCDGRDKPKCIVLHTETFLCPFNEVSEQFAFEEGEGDRSYAHWQKVQRSFFSEYGNFKETEILICERFKVVHQH